MLDLRKLACEIDSFDHYNVLSLLCNGQLINLLGFVKMSFSNFRVFGVNSMLKTIL